MGGVSTAGEDHEGHYLQIVSVFFTHFPVFFCDLWSELLGLPMTLSSELIVH